ncbi:exo-beta-N-acetylmuramidase NamZ family protein [Patiriisocius marinus]|uniref:exo-beta-N-acetylmuramidase NamZ family protein n=1 Tax=Patiriisocius marinus TaxID=1397112 RepID=UPI00232BFCC9|nr:DUF1343 domain-containing protein [Patiriisocius marinus]
MVLAFFKNTVFITLLSLFSCGNSTSTPLNEQTSISNQKTIAEQTSSTTTEINTNIVFNNKPNDTTKRVGRTFIEDKNTIRTGANQFTAYMPLLKGKKVGIVANQTSIVNDSLDYTDERRIVDNHLVDFIMEFDNQVVKVFAPEHGFRGKADAGEIVKDGVDVKTGIPIVSLYGKNKKPTPEQLKDIDIMVFDIQDVGARFYTYISSLHYVMEACAEAGIPVIVLDRPNPNGHYIDGPILEREHASFVGMHPIPVVHGMTIGEYAQMINGEGWLKNSVKCDLTVIKMKQYNREMEYSLPIKPSPNLPNDVAINLYPSLCFFEGTIVSAGRGTETQFQVFGAPSLPSKFYNYQYTPQANEGAKHPKFKGETCNGLDLRQTNKLKLLNLEWLIDAYVANGKKKTFFNNFFVKLAGTNKLQEQIEKGYTAREIRKTWLKGLENYNQMRQQYFLY